jgi:hypothetical protein
MRRTGFVVIAVVFLVGCIPARYSTSSQDWKSPKSLIPYGIASDAPALIRYIEPNSSAASVVSKGDLVLAVDTQPVNGTFNLWVSVKPDSKFVHIRSRDGSEKYITLTKLIDPQSHRPLALPFDPGQTILFKLQNPAYTVSQDAALLYPQNSIALISTSVWDTEPRYLEVYLELRVDPACQDCKLENIAVMDLSRKSWLTPVPPDYIAWALYPEAGQAPNMIPVPPPTPVGYTATSTLSGTLNTYSYGNSLSGTYYGTGVSTVTPYYDYTATNMAMIYNLAAAIKQNNIIAHSRARVTFVTRRQSNLRVGQLNPGERVTGFVHYQLPNGFNGPFLVVVKTGNLQAVRFDLNNSDDSSKAQKVE